MSDSCCICGLVLATDDSELPQWCKDIRALCWIGGRPILTETGYTDDDVIPFNLPIPSDGFTRFYYRCGPPSISQSPDYCYPFHSACWSLLQESNGIAFSDKDITAFFNIFDSFHYSRNSNCLKWGHNYHFEDMLGVSLPGDVQCLETDLIAANKVNEVILADPLHLDLRNQSHGPIVILEPKALYCHRPHLSSDTSRLLLLPPEVLELVLCNLDFHDARRLLQASAWLCQQFGQDGRNLSSLFWSSRFSRLGEAGFARSICPSTYTWREWFFKLEFEMSKGPSGVKMSLQNRKRIWKLGVELIAILRSVNNPARAPHGDSAESLPVQIRCSTSCLALSSDAEGCQELKQIRVSFRGSRIRTLTPTYIYVSNRRLVSGLTLTTDDYRSIDLGYVDGHCGPMNPSSQPEFLWIVSSAFGFEEISLKCPEHILPNQPTPGGHSRGVVRWPIKSLRSLYIGLDAMRMVRICVEGLEEYTLDDIVWQPPFSLPAVSLHKSDIVALHKLQRASFAPASTLCIKPMNGHLTVIKVHSALGWHAGINAVQLVYDTGLEIPWGYADDTASLSFFLDKAERLTKVIVYKIGPLVQHVQFVTNLQRGSVMPPLPADSDMECFHYEATNSGYITGFFGCYSVRYPLFMHKLRSTDFGQATTKQLSCLGVIATTSVTSLVSHWSPPKHARFLTPEHCLREMPLGGIRNHGECHSRVLLRERYQSIQVSLNPIASRYRSAGQVTGLLFRTGDGGNPNLLGQLTGAGKIYYLEETEQIVDLVVTTRKPRYHIIERSGLSQVGEITIVTNQRRIYLGPKTTSEREFLSKPQHKRVITEVIWDFNAMFDRVRYFYEPQDGH